MFDQIIQFLSPAGWLGMLILAAWQFLTTKKERKLSQNKDSTAITAADVENAKSIIMMFRDMNKELEDKIEKQTKRIGILEDNLRKQAFEHNKMIDEMRSSYTQKIEEMDAKNRVAFQEMESYHRQKCKECEERIS